MFEKRKAAKAKEQRDTELRQFAATVIDEDGVVSRDNEKKLLGYLDQHGYAEGNVIGEEIPRDVLNAFSLGLANDGRFFQSEVNLLLKVGEVAFCERAGTLLKEVTDREFRGGSRGVSVPLGHGIRYRTGAVRGHMVTVGTHWQPVDAGLLTVTDRRVVYTGDRKTLEFLFTKLAALHTYSDAIDLGVTNRQATSTFKLAEPEFVAGMIRAGRFTDKRLELPGTKTASAPRTVATRPILEYTLTSLRERHQDAPMDAYMFATSRGTKPKQDNYRNRVLYPARERANKNLEAMGEPPLPQITPQGLRCTFATILYALSVPEPLAIRNSATRTRR
jgi:hypothetical protein